jgi:hypothetical protein
MIPLQSRRRRPVHAARNPVCNCRRHAKTLTAYRERRYRYHDYAGRVFSQ